MAANSVRLWTTFSPGTMLRRFNPRATRQEVSMHVVRWGSFRYHEQKFASLSVDYVNWEPRFMRVECRTYYVPDFNTNARHNWTLSIEPKDMAVLINAMAAGIDQSNSAEIGKDLRPALGALLSLASAAEKSDRAVVTGEAVSA
jgi:hypothetical protein